MEKEKKGFKIKRITFIVIIFVMIILAGNVFAALSGKNNLFFAIRDLVVEKELEGKDEILIDRDETDLVEKSESKDDEIIELEDKDESLNIVLSKKDEEYAKNIIKSYYKLLSKKETETVSIFEELDLRVDMTQDLKEYTPENYKEHPENYMWTGIKYSDFNSKMGNYMNDKIIKEKFFEYVEYEDYLYCEENVNWENLEYEVENFELVFVSNDQNECTYDVDVKKGNEFIEETITLGKGNGDFVIKEILNNKGDVKADDFENLEGKNNTEYAEVEKENTISIYDKSKKENNKNDYSKYLGTWYDNGLGSEFTVENIGNNLITFSWGIYRTGGMDDITIPLKDNKAIFYYSGYNDSNYNSIEEDNEFFCRKGIIELRDNDIKVVIENCTHKELSENMNLNKTDYISGAGVISGDEYVYYKNR